MSFVYKLKTLLSIHSFDFPHFFVFIIFLSLTLCSFSYFACPSLSTWTR